MSKGLYTIVFMIITTIVFISILAFINEVTGERIAQNLKIDRYKSILYAFDIFPKGIDETKLSKTSTTADIPWDEKQLLQEIDDQIRVVKITISDEQKKLLNNSLLPLEDSVSIFIRYHDKKNIAYGFPLKGKGLWGTISAFGVISADLQKMIGIDFTDQVETPGLGARILETEFKYFFRELDLSGFREGSKSPIIMVKSKSQPNTAEKSNSFQAITGATQTVNGVLNMLNTDLKFYIRLIEENQTVLNRADLD